MVIYAKIRHFIDVMPAFFLFIAFGISFIFEHSRGFWRAFCIIILGAVLFHLVWIDMNFYPYEPSYFNFLVGGTIQFLQTANYLMWNIGLPARG